MSTICRYCDSSLAAHYSNIYSRFVPCLQSLPVSEQGNIIEGLARLISKLPEDQTFPALQQLVVPISNNLGSLLQANNLDHVSCFQLEKFKMKNNWQLLMRKLNYHEISNL